MQYSELNWIPEFPGSGWHRAKLFFPNGYGISVVKWTGDPYYTNLYDYGLCETAIVIGTEGGWFFHHDMPNHIRTHQDEQEVNNAIKKVKSLPRVSERQLARLGQKLIKAELEHQLANEESPGHDDSIWREMLRERFAIMSAIVYPKKQKGGV